ncbi:MAG TPA: hypothetical protein VGL72_01945 [Bryobacteraceae bacterium]|jgi:hypothetical protein
MIGRFFRSIYHWMALLGLAMKDDEPLEVRDPDRQWGLPVNGLMLSAKAKGSRLSVVIKNAGTNEVRENIPEWIFFYQLEISGSPALTTFGKHALEPSRALSRRTELILTPAKAIEAEIPVDSLYELKGTSRVTATCEIAGTRLRSNEVTLS